MEVVASLSQGRTAAAQCGLFTHKSVPVTFEPPCTIYPLTQYINISVYQKTNVFHFISRPSGLPEPSYQHILHQNCKEMVIKHLLGFKPFLKANMSGKCLHMQTLPQVSFKHSNTYRLSSITRATTGTCNLNLPLPSNYQLPHTTPGQTALQTVPYARYQRARTSKHHLPPQ